MLEAIKSFHRLPNRSPYYLIAWRLVWCIPMYASLCVAALFAGLAWGPRAAATLMRDSNRF